MENCPVKLCPKASILQVGTWAREGWGSAKGMSDPRARTQQGVSPLTPSAAGLANPYLALSTPGTIHSCIQLGVTGGPHGAPERVADILQGGGQGPYPHLLLGTTTCPAPSPPPRVPWESLLGAGTWCGSIAGTPLVFPDHAVWGVLGWSPRLGFVAQGSAQLTHTSPSPSLPVWKHPG